MSEYLLTIKPLRDKLKDIKESLYCFERYEQDGELFEYGKYEKEFELYRLDCLRSNSKIVTKKDFLKSLQDKLDEIELFFIQKEKEGIVKSNELLKEIFECRNLIKESLKVIKSPLTKKNIKSSSFNWEPESDRELLRFYEDLINGGFIEKEAGFNTFKEIFSTPIIPPRKPILWLKEIQDLVFLFDNLSKRKIISKKSIHSIIEANCLFRTKKNDSLSRNNLDTAKSRLNKVNPPIPKSGKEILKIIEVVISIRKKLKTS